MADSGLHPVNRSGCDLDHDLADMVPALEARVGVAVVQSRVAGGKQRVVLSVRGSPPRGVHRVSPPPLPPF